MRRTFLALFVWMVAFAAECRAQALGSGGVPLFPMVIVDEASLPHYPMVAYNRPAWDDAVKCLRELPLLPAGFTDTMPPEVRVVPFAATMRVHDLTADSVVRSQDSTSMGLGFEPPTDAYSLLHTGVVLMTTNASQSFRVMRHEAIHFLLWRAFRVLGHPKEAFQPCDIERPVP